MLLPMTLATGRLRLIVVTPGDAADMLAGRRQDRWHEQYPRREDLDAVALVVGSGPQAQPEEVTWGPRHVVLGQAAVGTIGFFGSPTDGFVEVGFGLVPAVRGDGLAAEALMALAAQTDRLGVGVRAAVAPDNRAGLRTLAGCGFTDLRGSDEDGHLVMARPIRQVIA